MSPYVPIPDYAESDDKNPTIAGGSTAHDRPTAQEDFPCPSCGYNMRGVPYGNKCPECGADPHSAGGYNELDIKAPRLGRLIDVILLSGGAQRRRWAIGLSIATMSMVAVIGLRLGYFVLGLSGSGAFDKYYLWGGLAVAIAWTSAVFFIVPPSIGKHWPKLVVLRRAVLATQLLWLPAYALWLLRESGATQINPNALAAGYLTLRAVAGIGFIALGQLMVFICEEAELEAAARRFNTASWLIAIPTLLAQVFSGSITWMEGVLQAMVLIWWFWMLAYYAMGFLHMRQHAAWAIRHARDSAGREQRIAEKKRHLERLNEATIRRYPEGQGGDTPLAPR